jgi:hypothetical protein
MCSGQAEADHPKDNSAAVQQYNDWQQEHYRRFKNQAQACFIGWVTTGDKYNVEYNFGLVDVDSIMARIEQSKKSMRDNQIFDANGADEVQLVTLNPKNWATLCRDKAENWYASHGNFSVDQVIAEVDRLTKLQLTLEALQQAVADKKYPALNPAQTTPLKPTTELSAVDDQLRTAYSALYAAQGALNAMKSDDSNRTAAVTAVNTAQTDLNKSLDEQAQVAMSGSSTIS